MLGLGNTIVSGQGLGYTLVDTITSDFTSGSGSGGTGNVTDANSNVWSNYIVTEGDLTKTLNATVDGSAGWLKCVYDTNQTSNSGIFSNLNDFVTKPGDYQVISFKIYLDGNWDGTDSVSTSVFISGAAVNVELSVEGSDAFPSNSFGVDQDTVATVSGLFNVQTSNNTKIHIYFNSTQDRPQADAWFAIKDVEMKTYRRG